MTTLRGLAISVGLIFGLALPMAGLAQEESPEAKGYRLTEEAQTKGEGFLWSIAEGRMVLIDAAGARAERRFTSKVLEETDGGEDGRGLLVFSFPPDIAKTALLTVSNKDRDDDQWLYLPALKRVKRVAASGQTGSFVGSEFTFEDLRPSDKDDFKHKWLAEVPCPSLPELLCHQIERDPLDEESGYSRIVAYLDTKELRLTAADYYDRSGRLLKVMTVSGFTLYKDKYWRADSLRMINKVNGKITEMIWESVDFDTPLTEDDLSTRALERLQ